ADLAPATQISAGHGHTCALLEGGRLRCWGDNRSGQTRIPRDPLKVRLYLPTVYGYDL
ncbi:MAG: hypothetical protein EOM24_23400, partial [Chloroflexia bacterium]|nr:hypothetical protein [Chloroflexia bacterium]